MSVQAIAIGCSLGGFQALKTVLSGFRPGLGAAVVVCAHTGGDNDIALLCELLGAHCALPVCEAVERQPMQGGHVYVAPGGYHLLLEDDRHFALSVDPPVSFARPSIDVLFESVAEVCGAAVVGVILTGANADGARGLAAIRGNGGIAVVQSPQEAEAPAMPTAALELAGADHCLGLDAIATLIDSLGRP